MRDRIFAKVVRSAPGMRLIKGDVFSFEDEELLSDDLERALSRKAGARCVGLCSPSEGVFVARMGRRSRGVRGYLPAGEIVVEIVDAPVAPLELDGMDDRAAGGVCLAGLHV